MRKYVDMQRAKDLYFNHRLSTVAIAPMLGCSLATLCSRFKEAGISFRPNGSTKLKCPTDILINEYRDQRLSLTSIAALHSMNAVSVMERLIKAGVQMRDRIQALRDATLTIPESEYPTICSRYDAYERPSQIAKDYSVHRSTIHKILKQNGRVLGRTGRRLACYRGGLTPLHSRIRNCDKDEQWRRACMVRDDYTCQISGERGGRLCVHHIRSFSTILDEFLRLNPELDAERDCETLFNRALEYDPFWDLANGQTLRSDIHREFHKRFVDPALAAKIMRLARSGLNTHRIAKTLNLEWHKVRRIQRLASGV